MASKIKLSPRSKVRFSDEELTFLGDYIKDEPAAFANIKNNTGIARSTVLRVIERGWAELSTALPLRDFIKAVQEAA